MGAFDTYERVWQHSTQRGLRKLLMLALAKFANKQGICWPSLATLCELTGETNKESENYIRQLLNALEKDGEIVSRPSKGGRGATTVYGILVGLDEPAADQLRSLIARCKVSRGLLIIEPENPIAPYGVSAPETQPENPVLENGVPENPVIQSGVSPQNPVPEYPVPEYPVLQSGKTPYYSSEDEAPNLASQSTETTKKKRENYKGTHGGDGDVGAAAEKTAGSGSTPPPPPSATRKGSGPPAHVAYLSRQGMGAAHLFADCDPDAAIADFNARIADQWPIKSIVTAWKMNPPRPGAIYERRQDAENRPERPAHAQAHSSARPARAPRPGEPEYYERFKPKPKA